MECLVNKGKFPESLGILKNPLGTPKKPQRFLGTPIDNRKNPKEPRILEIFLRIGRNPNDLARMSVIWKMFKMRMMMQLKMLKMRMMMQLELLPFEPSRAV